MSKKIPLWLCLVISLIVGLLGYLGGIASTSGGSSFFADLFAVESRAKTKDPKSIKRTTYSLEYPSNWKIDRSEPEFDLDHYVTIESPGTSYVWLMISVADQEPEEAAESQVESFTDDMRSLKVSDFTEYGELRGAGKRVTGRYFAYRAEVNIFCVNEGGLNLTVIEFAYTEDLPLSKPGFDLIRESIRFTPEAE